MKSARHRVKQWTKISYFEQTCWNPCRYSCSSAGIVICFLL